MTWKSILSAFTFPNESHQQHVHIFQNRLDTNGQWHWCWTLSFSCIWLALRTICSFTYSFCRLEFVRLPIYLVSIFTISSCESRCVVSDDVQYVSYNDSFICSVAFSSRLVAYQTHKNSYRYFTSSLYIKNACCQHQVRPFHFILVFSCSLDTRRDTRKLKLNK